ncbi:MAG: hypothetical protein ACK5B9_08865 [Flavobacteriia bacterium]|jgi:hypothetical protein
MSYTDEEIDKLFREAGLNQKAPVFQDSFFEEVEALLPQKRNRKGIFWMLGLMASLLVGIGTFLGINYSDSKTQIVKSNLKNANKIIATNSNIQSNSNNLTTEIKNSSADVFLNKAGFENKYSSNKLAKTSNSFKDKKYTTHFFENNAITTNALNNLIIESEDKASKDEKSLDGIENNEVSLAKLPAQNYGLNQSYGELLANPFPLKTAKLFLTASLASGFSENFLKKVPAIGKPVFVNTIGLNLRYNFRKYNLSAGIQYSNYQTHELDLNRSSKVYSFEVTKYNQTIDYKWISTIQLPISIEKDFKNHTLAFGIDPSIVLGSCVDFSKNQNGIIMEDARYYSNMIGLRRFYLGAHISYDLKLAKDYAFGIKISNQLINPLDISKFEGEINKNPFQAQLTIKKYFKIK